MATKFAMVSQWLVSTSPTFLFFFWEFTLIFIRSKSDHRLPLSLTYRPTLLFSWLDWCDSGVWRCQLKICCSCCWFWWWGTCWQQFCRGFDAEDCSRYWGCGLVMILNLKFCWDFEAGVCSRFLKLKFGLDSEAEIWPNCGMTWRSYFGEGTQSLGQLCLLQYFVRNRLSRRWQHKLAAFVMDVMWWDNHLQQ